MFGKFKVCLDKEINRAIMLACIASSNQAMGGRYALCKGRLIVAFHTMGDGIITHPSFAKAFNTFASNVPQKYGDKIDVWEWNKYVNEVPEKIQNKSGYVSMFHPEDNRPVMED